MITKKIRKKKQRRKNIAVLFFSAVSVFKICFVNVLFKSSGKFTPLNPRLPPL